MSTDPDPFEEGQRAARENIPAEGNPYRDGSEQHSLWAAGHESIAREALFYSIILPIFTQMKLRRNSSNISNYTSKIQVRAAITFHCVAHIITARRLLPSLQYSRTKRHLIDR